jgi:hypothetical protein
MCFLSEFNGPVNLSRDNSMKFKKLAIAFAALGLMAATAQATTFGNTLRAEQTMGSGDNLLSNNGLFSLAMQSDGNLVIYRLANGSAQPLWSTGRAGTYSYVRMQQDGNLALYHSDNTWSWTSGTGGRPINAGYRLVLEENGSLDIYGPAGEIIWNANRPAGDCGPQAASLPLTTYPICSYPANGVLILGTVQARCVAQASYLASLQYAVLGSSCYRGGGGGTSPTIPIYTQPF